MALSLPILTFHDINERPSVISISPEVFGQGMAMLHAKGYRALGLMEAVDYLRRGAPFPSSSFVVTFDDGYQSAYEKAFPVLERYNVSATIFLTVGKSKTANPATRLPSFEGRSMLSWREIREMHRSGIAFGAHTLTHPDLTRLPLDRVRSEVCDGKKIIEEALSTPVLCFAYPYGNHNAHVRTIVQRYFACACSDYLGLLTQESELYSLERIDGYYLRSHRLFGLIVSRFFPFYVWAYNIRRRIRRVARVKKG